MEKVEYIFDTLATIFLAILYIKFSHYFCLIVNVSDRLYEYVAYDHLMIQRPWNPSQILMILTSMINE